MTSETDEQTRIGDLVSGIRETVSVHYVVALAVGVLAGYSISVLGEDAVVVPGIGPVSGVAVGAAGLLAAGATYRRFGGGCGCAGDCDGSCSYEP